MKCLLSLGVHANDGSAIIDREIDIPFCPFHGLEIGGIVNPHGNLSCGTVSSVEWSAETGILRAHLVNDTNESDETLDEKLDDWGEGWEVRIFKNNMPSSNESNELEWVKDRPPAEGDANENSYYCVDVLQKDGKILAIRWDDDCLQIWPRDQDDPECGVIAWRRMKA